MLDTTLCVGATGLQGGSVARALLARGLRVRALTRKPHGEAAASLRAQGAEIVEGDLSDLATLTRAMHGCTRAFGVTNYWEHFGSEVAQGKNLVDAAARANVQHLVLSSLASAEALSGGALAVPHMDSKAAIERYARLSPVPTTFVHVAFYFENFLSWFVPRPEADGALHVRLPQGETKLAGIAVADVGEVVASLFARAPRGETIGVVGDELSLTDYASGLSTALGRDVRYTHVDPAAFAALPFPGAADLAAMFDLNRRFLHTRAADMHATRALHPRALAFADWASRNADALRAAVATA
ncbi:MAG: NmrA/HSCARG family protein [Polyangiales bacterium]